jgi:hypothetical protein
MREPGMVLGPPDEALGSPEEQASKQRDLEEAVCNLGWRVELEGSIQAGRGEYIAQ